MSSSLSRRSRSSGCLLTLLQLLLVYLLSQGPVLALYSSQRIQGPLPGAVTTFYQPLVWLCTHTPLGTPMNAYNAWWSRMLKKD